METHILRASALSAVTLVAVSLVGSCSKAPISPGSNGSPGPNGTPSFVPQPDRIAQVDTAPFGGFTLVAPLSSTRVHLIDMAGEEVHHWDTLEKAGESTYLTPRGTLLRCGESPDHPTFQDAGGHGGGIFEYGPKGKVLWAFKWDNEQGLQHHDVEELPNGNVLFIAWDRGTREEALAAGRDPELLEGAEWWSGAIYEVRPTRPEGGEIVWSWHSKDHLVQNYDRDLVGYGDPASRPERIDINGDRDPKPPTEKEKSELDAQMRAAGYAGGGPVPAEDSSVDDSPTDDAGEGEEDEPELTAEEKAKEAADKERKDRVRDADWTHMNAVDYNPRLDQIAISIRRFDEIWIIDHSTTREEAKGPGGDLLYRFGNSYAYGMGQWRERRFLGQHNVQWVEDGQIGAGNLIVFNNGASPRSWSTIVEWWAPRDTQGGYPRVEGQPFGPSQFEWSYQADDIRSFFGPFISGVQRLPNGNTLICCGPDGRVFEVTQDGDTVWDWQNAFDPVGPDPKKLAEDKHPVALFRATRYGPDSPNIRALREAGVNIPASPGEAPELKDDEDENVTDE